MVVGEAQQRAAQIEQIRSALRRLNPEFHRSDISWAALDALVERVEAAAQENKELLGGLYLTKHNLEKAEARLAELEGLWHCTLEDKAAADAHFRKMEARVAELEELVGEALRHEPYIGGEWGDRARVALAGVPIDEEET